MVDPPPFVLVKNIAVIRSSDKISTPDRSNLSRLLEFAEASVKNEDDLNLFWHNLSYDFNEIKFLSRHFTLVCGMVVSRLINGNAAPASNYASDKYNFIRLINQCPVNGNVNSLFQLEQCSFIQDETRHALVTFNQRYSLVFQKPIHYQYIFLYRLYLLKKGGDQSVAENLL